MGVPKHLLARNPELFARYTAKIIQLQCGVFTSGSKVKSLIAEARHNFEGNTEGAIKGWETRRHGGAREPLEKARPILAVSPEEVDDYQRKIENAIEMEKKAGSSGKRLDPKYHSYGLVWQAKKDFEQKQKILDDGKAQFPDRLDGIAKQEKKVADAKAAYEKAQSLHAELVNRLRKGVKLADPAPKPEEKPVSTTSFGGKFRPDAPSGNYSFSAESESERQRVAELFNEELHIKAPPVSIGYSVWFEGRRDAKLKALSVIGNALPASDPGHVGLVYRKTFVSPSGAGADRADEVNYHLLEISRFVPLQNMPPNLSVVCRTIPDGRSFCLGQQIVLSRRGEFSEYERRKTMFHEFGHALEHGNKAISKAAVEFLKKRTANSPEVTLNAISKREKIPSRFGRSEKTREDDFWKAFGDSPSARRSGAYAGKAYYTRIKNVPASRKISSTEIVSMGFEQMLHDPVTFAHGDPEWFNFVLDAIKGRIK